MGDMVTQQVNPGGWGSVRAAGRESCLRWEGKGTVCWSMDGRRDRHPDKRADGRAGGRADARTSGGPMGKDQGPKTKDQGSRSEGLGLQTPKTTTNQGPKTKSNYQTVRAKDQGPVTKD